MKYVMPEIESMRTLFNDFQESIGGKERIKPMSTATKTLHRYGKSFAVTTYSHIPGKADVEIYQDGYPITLPNCSTEDLYAIGQFLIDVAEGL